MSEARDGVALITGASAGLGEEFAAQLAQSGQAVLAVARRVDRLEALSARARNQGWAPIHPLVLDITAENAGQTLKQRAAELGGPSWLINNAGFGAYGPVESQSGTLLASMVRLNCEAVVSITSEILPLMLTRRRGIIVNVASVAGFQPTPYFAVYGATKAFMLSYSESLAEELRAQGITVTALCPGPVSTEFQQVARKIHPGTEPSALSQARSMDAATCVRIALQAARRGQVIVVPGVKNRVLSWGSQLIPRGMVRRITAAMMKSSERGP